jgi:exopolyphosphatase/guanosine-5'-triphosphate,3'-diphosphate pyrophosphatase
MRVAVVDIGTNSTRLLIADVKSAGPATSGHAEPGGPATGESAEPDRPATSERGESAGPTPGERGESAGPTPGEPNDPGKPAAGQPGEPAAPTPAAAVTELVRLSRVTRLGAGVDSGGALSQEAVARTCAVLADYRRLIDEHGCEANLAVLTSAVRDARDGAQFTARVREEFGLDARTLSGDEEAQLTFLGAMSDREPDPQPTVVIDIGGGSTEFIVGHDHTAGFHTSLQAGVVRMSERHIHSDPPAPQELQNLARDTRAIFLAGLPPQERAPVTSAIAVAGTATSAAAIDQELDPYDPARVHRYRLLLAAVELLLARLADMTEDQRRNVVGLHPDRAPTIVAGMVLLAEAMRAFELESVEVSEHDILRGGALRLAGCG